MRSKISDVDKVKSFLVLCKPEFKKIEKDSYYILSLKNNNNLSESQIKLITESFNQFFSQRNSHCIIILEDINIKKSILLKIIYKLKKFLMIVFIAIRNKI
jgi:ethanolamine utilization protein EutA (predicted chaperonin)